MTVKHPEEDLLGEHYAFIKDHDQSRVDGRSQSDSVYVART